MDLFKVTQWGPKRLRAIFTEIQDAINARTPLPGLGMRSDEKPSGVQLSTKIAAPAIPSSAPPIQGGGSDTSGASSGYTVVATEFVDATNASTPDEELLYSHGIGAGRLTANGDSIRATYSLNISSSGSATNLSLRFGDGNQGDLVIGDGNNLNLDSDLTVKIEALIIRVNANTCRYVVTISASTNFADTETDTQFLRCATSGNTFVGALSTDRFLTLWGGSEDAGGIIARMALIEYVPA